MATLEQKTLEFITGTSVLIEKAAAADRRREEQQEQADALIPQVVEAMVNNGRILPREAEKLAGVLKDPVKALEVLMKTAEHRTEGEQFALGTPQGGPTVKAAHTSLTSPFVGRRDSRPKESDLAFLAALGLTS